MDVDGAGRVAVANAAANALTIFSPSATGNAAPAATIAGASTSLSAPSFVAFTPPPEAVTGRARHVRGTRARLTGTVTPDGSRTTWRFEYRPQGTTVWQKTPVASAGTGGSAVRVRTTVNHLHRHTKYEFRLKAENPGGNATGEIHSFKTKRRRT
jgi:hypothetical protein